MSDPGHASRPDPGMPFHAFKSLAKTQLTQPIPWVREEEFRKEVGVKEAMKEEGGGDVVEEVLTKHMWQQQA